MRQETNLTRSVVLMIALAGVTAASAQTSVHAALQPANERKPAPTFALKDSSGKTVKLKNYRGKALLLDFWATWCHGCREEIPWFSEFQKTYRKKGLAVVGISMDEEGWKVLKPFLAETHVPYRMVLGDQTTAKQYGIDTLPDTFLIDRHGKVAAAYVAGMVDKDDLERNIKAVLSKP